MNDGALFSVKGHVRIVDDLGNVLADAKNSIHPQNVSRIISRALANEPNSSIYRMAFGNGGTQVGTSLTVEFNHPNDGITPDPKTWNSDIYNETYSEIVDDSNDLIGYDPGSAGRTAGGDNRADDPTSIEHISGPGVRSNELGLQSQVVVVCVLNPGEPRGQQTTDTFPGGEFEGGQPSDGEFIFDEIGLYTSGAPHVATSGYHNVSVGDKRASDDTGLDQNTTYSFIIQIDGTAQTTVTFTTPSDPSITYQDLITAINTGDTNYGLSGSTAIPGAKMFISGDTFNSQTYGQLSVVSLTSGATSSIVLTPGTSDDLFTALGGTLNDAVPGSDAGVPNSPSLSSKEGERLLAHVTFSPVLKSSTRTLQITYTLTIAVARTDYPSS